MPFLRHAEGRTKFSLHQTALIAKFRQGNTIKSRIGSVTKHRNGPMFPFHPRDGFFAQKRSILTSFGD